MNHKEVQEIIEKIEADFEVQKLNYKNVNVWPLLKFHLFWRLYKFENSDFKTRNIIVNSKPNIEFGFIKKIKFHFKNILTLKVSWLKHIKQSIVFNFKQADSSFLFIDAADNLYQDKIENKKISKYIFSYIEFLKSRGSTSIINIHNSKITNNERFFPVSFYNTEFLFRYYELLNFYKHKFNKKKYLVNYFSNFKIYLSDKPYSSVISESFIMAEMEKILIYEKIWKKILNKIKPKAVFVECYYGSNYNYGLFLAASRLNIKTVDIQHGVALGVFYTGWYKLSIETAKLLPTNYWCWSNYDEQIVNITRNSNNVFKAISGGNLWLKHCLDSNNKNESNLFIENLIKETKPEKIILVTLQHSIPISTNLIEAIKNSPKKWLWLIRFHPFDYVDPNYRKSYIDFFSELKNVEYLNCTNSNLYPLLSLVNAHVTHHSNVAVEAITFNVPTILLGNLFQEIYKDYINAGNFYISTNSNQILSYISEGIKVNEASFDIFKMRYDINNADVLLKQLLA